MDTKVNWHGRLTFTGTADSGFTLPLGTEPNVGGDNDGFRPMELMALSIAGCTAMDVISIMMKKRQDVTDFEVKVHTEQSEQHPKVFTNVKIDYIFSGHDIDEAAAVRSIELSAIRYCPAQGMLAKIMPFDLRYQIYEDLGDGKRRLITSGNYTMSDA